MQQSISGTTRPSRATSTETPNPPSSGGKKVRRPLSHPPHPNPQPCVIWREKVENLPQYTGFFNFIPSLPSSFIPPLIPPSFIPPINLLHSSIPPSFIPPLTLPSFITSIILLHSSIFHSSTHPSILHSSTHPSILLSFQAQIRS